MSEAVQLNKIRPLEEPELSTIQVIPAPNSDKTNAAVEPHARTKLPPINQIHTESLKIAESQTKEELKPIDTATTVVTPNGAYINKGFEDVDLSETAGREAGEGTRQRVVHLADPNSSERNGEDDDHELVTNGCLRYIQEKQKLIDLFFTIHGKKIKYVVGIILLLGYGGYFAYAIWRSLEGEDQIRLLWMTILAAVLCSISLIRRTCGDQIYNKIFTPIITFIKKHFTVFKWGFILAFSIFVIVFIIVDIAISRPRNMVSLSGYVIYIFILFIFSTNPRKVSWRPVCWGLGIQFVFALITLRTPWGLQAFQWIGERISEFLAHTDAGSKFVFGDSYEDHRFAFKILPVVIYFSAVISVLYYLGVMQLVILKLAWVMQRTLGTTAAESVNAAGNIFIGQTEAPLLIRPLIPDMSRSELHAVMTGGFATIAGSVMASFILFGVKASHLITASVMAAPCALGVSKLFCPETNPVKKDKDVTDMERPPQRNVIEAVSAGASSAISLVANIAANLLAFMALLAFINATLMWFGARVGLSPPEYPALTFQLICSYLLWPFAFIMGVDTPDCRKVAELIGLKTFINEFVAYTELGKLIQNRKDLGAYTGAWEWVNGDILLKETGKTLVGGIMSARSEVISTYALCGFANLSSIGMVMGALGSMCDKQRPIIAQLALRAMIAGNIVCFMNACTAGLLYQGE